MTAVSPRESLCNPGSHLGLFGKPGQEKCGQKKLERKQRPVRNACTWIGQISPNERQHLQDEKQTEKPKFSSSKSERDPNTADAKQIKKRDPFHKNGDVKIDISQAMD